MSPAPQISNSVCPSAWNSVREGLESLNRRLIREVERRRPKHRAPLDQLQGLVLHEEEVLQILLADRPTLDWEPEPEERTPCAAAELFHLSWAEEQCLWLGLACEVDSQYGKVIAFLQDDVTRRLPTVGLAIDLFWGRDQFPAGHTCFLAAGPLSRHRLLEIVEPFQGPATLSQRALRLDGRIAGLMLESTEIDDALAGWVDLGMPNADVACASVPPHVCERTLCLAASCFGDGGAEVRPVFHLHGRPGAGRRSLARYVCGHIGLPLLTADVRRLPSGAGRAEALWRLGREALLHPAAVHLTHFDDLLDESRREEREAFLESVGRYSPLTFLSGGAPWNAPLAVKQSLYVDIECPCPDASARVDLWSESLGHMPHTLGEEQIREVAVEFQFTNGQIREALLTARARSIWRHDPPPPLSAADIHLSCRLQATPHLGSLARRVEAAGVWDDIILPDPQKEQLQEMVAQVKRSQTVLGKWGFGGKYPYGLGLAALFEGTSGTGKTFAASIIAAELGLDLYKIDLASVVNKYIGETEKNLSRIFDEARDSNSILFFDEAEALFAKRAETVKDANDRYAGVETAHLLQRLESHTGIVILATNMKQNLDDAFLRRFRFIIHFPFPDDPDRERIWQRVFPQAAPISSDVDFRWLARRFKITAGHIKNIGLRAAFLAADRKTCIDTECILEAARREIEKMGKVYNPADFRFHGARRGDQREPEVA